MALAQQANLTAYHSQGLGGLDAVMPAKARPSRREEYQRRIVEKIKRHFDRRRKQWESNLQKQADVFSASSHHINDIDDTDSSETVTASQVEDVKINQRLNSVGGDSVTSPASEARVNDVTVTDSAHLKVVHSHCEKQTKNSSKWRVELDINEFLPNGEVLISSEGRTLTATGHVAKRKSRGSIGGSLEVKTQVVLDGEIYCRSMHVTTSTNGIMVIEVSVAHDTDS